MMPKTIPERADAMMERILRVYDEHMDMLEKMLGDEGGADDDEIVAEMVLAEYNFSMLSARYELSPDAFVEENESAEQAEDIDIWLGVLMREPDE